MQIKKWFHIITVKQIYTGFIFILPIINNQKNYEKQLKKCIPNLKKLMKKYEVSNLVLAEELRKNEHFLQIFKDNRILDKKMHILDGKELMQYLIKEILEYILQKQAKTTQLEDLYIMVKQENSYYKENIAFLSRYFKTINIITPCLNSYQKFANKLEGAMVTVTNNKKKSLRKAKWIVNFDFSNEEIKKYTIYRTATIIYLENDCIYQSNAFDGLHICKAGIDVSEEIKEFFMKQHLLEQCPITILYESTITNKRNFYAVKEQMKKDKVQIKKLFGIRGILAEEEYKKAG